MEFVPSEEFSRMSLYEKMGYLFGMILRHRQGIAEILNNPAESDARKFLYSIVLADGLARTIDCF